MREYCAFNAIDGTILCAPNRKSLNRAIRITPGKWYFDNESRRGVNHRLTAAFLHAKEVEWETEAKAVYARAAREATLYYWANNRAGK